MLRSWWRPIRPLLPCNRTKRTWEPAPHEADAWAWLDERERKHWQRYRHPGPKRRFALCRAALRAFLRGELDCGNRQLGFSASQHGKPFAVVGGRPARISFNVSHSGKHGLIALAPEGRLGVDVEERVPRHDLDGLIRAVLGPDEQAELASVYGSRRLHLFLKLWTFKEALIKALGVGFSLDVSRFQIPSALRRGMTTGIFQLPQLPEVRWRLEDLGNRNFSAAIAHELVSDTETRPESGGQSGL